VIAYHLLRDGGGYEDLGPNYFDEQKEQQVVWHLQHRLERLGDEVTVVKKAA
jgi:hypothetical protein